MFCKVPLPQNTYKKNNEEFLWAYIMLYMSQEHFTTKHQLTLRKEKQTWSSTVSVSPKSNFQTTEGIMSICITRRYMQI